MEIDSAYIREVRANEAFDYISEVNKTVPHAEVEPEGVGPTLHLGSFLENDVVRVLSIIFLAIIAGILVYKLFKIFTFESDKDDIPEDNALGDDTIYGHDWAKEIDALMRDEDYSEAIVLMYLRWLDKLNAEGKIIFSASKTPGMLLDEVRAKATAEGQDGLVHKTQLLTNHYLRIRYGHRKATREMAVELLSCLVDKQ